MRDRWPDDEARFKVVALLVVPLLLVGGIGYRLLTTARPVTSEEATALFRAETRSAPPAGGRASSGKGSSAVSSRTSTQDQERPRRPRGRSRADAHAPGARGTQSRDATRSANSSSAEAPTRTRGQRERAAPRRRGWSPGVPQEGVYNWSTRGYESFNGARRELPPETHRIVTHDDERNTWTNHHVFSKEREAWTRVRSNGVGYLTLWARNRIVFGPVTRDVAFSFDPPMLTNPVGEPVGTSWQGEWEGKTYGSYAGSIIGETSLMIDGSRVRVTIIQLDMELHGEAEGTSQMRFWVSNRDHMVVREHYVQDVETGAAKYHAEWQMTVKSMRPQR